MTATSDSNTTTSIEGIAAQVVAPDKEQLGHRMGLQLSEATPDRVVGTMPVAGNRQPYGLLHGGANAVLAETLGSVAAGLHVGEGRAAVGLELSCTHHRAATEGVITGVATPMHRGGSTATYEIVITDERGKRTCTARLTCLLRDKPPASEQPDPATLRASAQNNPQE